MEVVKYQGIGNDYLVYDVIKNEKVLTREQIKKICDRNFGVGADGILVGPYLDEEKKIRVRVFNSDGSEAERAGNGIRIFARYLKDAGYTLSERLTLETAGGSVKVRFLNDDGSRIQADMGKMSFGEEKTVTLGEERYSAFTTSIGNPHCVIPAETIDREKVCKLGKKIAESNMFKNGINVMLLQVEDKNNLNIEIFERGAGYILASGTCSCAAAAVAYKKGWVGQDVMVHMPGGKLWIQIDENWNLKMTGSVESIGSVKLTKEFEIRILMFEKEPCNKGSFFAQNRTIKIAQKRRSLL